MVNEMSETVLLTGGAGFIGSALVRYLINSTDTTVVNVDKLTYAGSLHSLGGADASERHHFHQEDIADSEAMRRLVAQYKPDYIMHLAAESHVDRSIDGPGELFKPISWALIICWKWLVNIMNSSKATRKRSSNSTIFRRMRYMEA